MAVPPEIITDILYRLPAKSLGRCRCVSKNWLSLISDPQFIKTHKKTLNKNHLIFNSNDQSLYSFPIHHNEAALRPKKLQFESHDVNFTFHGSCNGLILVSAHYSDDRHTLVIINPTTQEFVKLPESGYEMVDNLLEIEIMYGFGYDSLSDGYKVVAISYFHFNYLIPPSCMYIHVYSLRNNTWKRVDDSPYDHSYRRCLPGGVVNEYVHWIANKGSGNLPVIVAFCLANEKFSELSSPKDVDILSRKGCKLVDLDGKLGIFLGDEVWVMNEYGVRKSWMKIVIHRLNEISLVEPMIFYNKGKIILVSDDLMLGYDVEERTFCKCVDISRDLKNLKVKGCYVESLVSPKIQQI